MTTLMHRRDLTSFVVLGLSSTAGSARHADLLQVIQNPAPCGRREGIHILGAGQEGPEEGGDGGKSHGQIWSRSSSGGEAVRQRRGGDNVHIKTYIVLFILPLKFLSM
jgi:hypothetical protein